jgi:hypothetical protein
VKFEVLMVVTESYSLEWVRVHPEDGAACSEMSVSIYQTTWLTSQKKVTFKGK